MRRGLPFPRRPTPRPGETVQYRGGGFPGGPEPGERGEVLDVQAGRERWILVPPTVPDQRPRVRVLVRWADAGEAWVATSEIQQVEPG